MSNTSKQNIVFEPEGWVNHTAAFQFCGSGYYAWQQKGQKTIAVNKNAHPQVCQVAVKADGSGFKTAERIVKALDALDMIEAGLVVTR